MHKFFGFLISVIFSANLLVALPVIADTSPLPVALAASQTDASAAPATDNISPATLPTPASPVSKTVKTGSAAQLANLLGGLALILVLILGLSWFVKRFSQGGFMQNPTMKIVSSMPLGTRERLMLVDVGGKQLLLGVTATQIATLHVFDEPVVVQGDKTAPTNSEFSQKLMAILQQKNFVQPDDSSRKN